MQAARPQVLPAPAAAPTAGASRICVHAGGCAPHRFTCHYSSLLPSPSPCTPYLPGTANSCSNHHHPQSSRHNVWCHAVEPLASPVHEAGTVSMPEQTGQDYDARSRRALPDTMPVMVCHTHQLQAQSSLEAAAAALQQSLPAHVQHYQSVSSGCVRLEVPLLHAPTTTALRWLAGQQLQQAAGSDSKLLLPCVYFSRRHSSAPDTPLSSQAEASTKNVAAVAGVGAAWIWQGAAGGGFDSAVVQQMQRFVASDQPHIRIYGGTRFDTASQPSDEWSPLAAYVFSLPLLEYSERGSGAVLAVTLAWDTALQTAGQDGHNGHHIPLLPSSSEAATPVWGQGASSLQQAAERALAAIQGMQPAASPNAGAQLLQQQGSPQHVPTEEQWGQVMRQLLSDLAASQRASSEAGAANGSARANMDLDLDLARQEYLSRGQQGLDDLLAAVGGEAARPSQLLAGESNDAASGPVDPDHVGSSKPQLSKVVLARRTRLTCTGQLDPLWVLEALQERDPRAYQLYISNGQGTAFVACTPERLYARTGRVVASEAVAGTRARGPPGDVERDFWLSLELLHSQKDHREFVLVRDWIRDALASCSEQVDVEVPKSVLKQGAVQHLYGRLAARVRPGVNDSHILKALHPTPAVCGRPRDDAMQWLRERENFDRGYYAGPFGWVSGEGAEFAVAIRSALFSTDSSSSSSVHQASTPARHVQSATQQSTTHAYLYAGVGVVSGSEPASEWQELELKTRALHQLLQPQPELASLPNVNLAWCTLLVEECCRHGVNMFCIAPGSRSSPLTTAVARHPRARINICVDERSLGFWALGYGRATGKPAVVITSSGTAVANLLPACIEASQSEIPLLLVTADRPAELRDTGANQTIDQVRIFGGFTRWFQDVAAPDASVPGRTILTTVASACRYALGHASAAGPVHLNMQFREPLAPISVTWQQQQWRQGLDRWLAQPGVPYTANIHSSSTAVALHSTPLLQQAVNLLRSTRRGLIVVGELTNPEDAPAVLQLAQLLQWPVATDVLSGLRTSQQVPSQQQPGVLTATGTQGMGAHIISYMDHLLLGDKAWWSELAPDVVLQIGPRITSKRVNQFLEWLASSRSPAVPWLYVGTSASRHDAAHLVSCHVATRVPALAQHLATMQAAVHRPAAASFSSSNGGSNGNGKGIVNSYASNAGYTFSSAGNGYDMHTSYAHMLARLDAVAHEEIEYRLSTLPSMSEPAVARQLSTLLPDGHALFLGNSMPIRDMEMYASSSRRPGSGILSNSLRVAANRGASGIDGVLSTAAGYAEGASRPTTLVLGDLSFLHDTNGLNMLRAGEARPPLTVVLINNNGGGIFSFLPIAGALPANEFEPLWATPQNADFEGLCRSHGVPYQRVRSPEELQQALQAAWSLNRHSVVEVVTRRDTNLQLHRWLQQHVQTAIARAYGWAANSKLSSTSLPMQALADGTALSVSALTWSSYQLPLASPTTASSDSSVRQGYVLQLTCSVPGSGKQITGYGEVAPLPGLQKESLAECAAQLSLVSCIMTQQRSQPMTVPHKLALLGGRLEAWLSHATHLTAADWLPSVRCGLEMALLDCLAQCRGDGKLLPAFSAVSTLGASSPAVSVQFNGLIACTDPEQAAQQALALVRDHGYKALKIKVARTSSSPEQDAAVILAVRRAVGPDVVLRADANRGWDLDQACSWGRSVQSADLQYIEEPTSDPLEAPSFYETTGIHFAIDESVDDMAGGGDRQFIGSSGSQRASVKEQLCEMHKHSNNGLAAVVLKPTCIGGFERTLAVAETASHLGVQVVVSSSFDSPLGMAGLIELAAAADNMAAAAGRGLTQHGLGTVSWFSPSQLPSSYPALTASSVQVQYGHLVQQALQDLPLQPVARPDAGTWQAMANSRLHSRVHGVSLQNHQQSNQGLQPQQPAVVFLHGFMGSKEDWLPLMHAVAAFAPIQCVALDLPGHGGTRTATSHDTSYSLEEMADIVAEVIQAKGLVGCTLIGYSMGARVALSIALQHPHLLGRLVCISGTPGLKDARQAERRAAADADRAALLRNQGMDYFVQYWYQQNMWASLRSTPGFEHVVHQRARGNDVDSLADVLASASTGKMASMWSCLRQLQVATLLVTGDKDEKFSVISSHMVKHVKDSPAADLLRAVQVEGAGHAVQLERPWPVVRNVIRFVMEASTQ